jgi:hypothetical protein
MTKPESIPVDVPNCFCTAAGSVDQSATSEKSVLDPPNEDAKATMFPIKFMPVYIPDPSMLIEWVALLKAKVKGTLEVNGPLSLKTLIPDVLKFVPAWATLPVQAVLPPKLQKKSTFV